MQGVHTLARFHAPWHLRVKEVLPSKQTDSPKGCDEHNDSDSSSGRKSSFVGGIMEGFKRCTGLSRYTAT